MARDPKRGLYDKYDVVRTDGGCAVGARHERCSHFVLDLNHDARYAIPALRAYANACREELPVLSRDLVAVADAMERGEFTDIGDFMPSSVGPANNEETYTVGPAQGGGHE